MSDLHTITGISIMISGYAQLHCGLSTYDWQMLVYVAWFSSLTNFSCLTFLRKHLYEHRRERVWRLIAMGILVVLLMIAILPTGSSPYIDVEDYGTQDLSSLSRYAICYMSKLNIDPNIGAMNVAVSLILLGGAYIIRLVLLHKVLARRTLCAVRIAISGWSEQKLLTVWRTFCHDNWWSRLGRHMVYWPLLAIVLYVQVLTELLTSKFFEVGCSFTIIRARLTSAGVVACSQLCMGCDTPFRTSRRKPLSRSSMDVRSSSAGDVISGAIAGYRVGTSCCPSRYVYSKEFVI
jgi:hypothetical protein